MILFKEMCTQITSMHVSNSTHKTSLLYQLLYQREHYPLYRLPYLASQMQVQIVPRGDAFDGGVSGSLCLCVVHSVLLLQQLLQRVERGRGELEG